MVTETATQPHLGPKALLAFLRDHPDARFQPPTALAQQFGLPTNFVEQVLSKAEPQPVPDKRYADKFFQELYLLNKRIKSFMDRSARHPTVFVVTSTLLAEVLLLALSALTGHSLVNLRQGQLNLTIVTGPGVLIPFAMVCAQMILFFRRGAVRFALYGALAYWTVGGSGLGLLEWWQHIDLPSPERAKYCLLILVAHFAVCCVYAAAGSFIALMGEYHRLLRENRRVEKMSRQELLERLFQLQKRMDLASGTVDLKPKRSKLTDFLKFRLLAASLGLGFLLQVSLRFAVGTRLSGMITPSLPTAPPLFDLLITGSLAIMLYVTNFWLAYLAPNMRTALLVGLLFAVGADAASLMWPDPRILHLAAERLNIAPSMIQLFEALAVPVRDVAIAGVAGAIALVQTKTLEELNLQRNDEATLVAEQLKIQWKLAENACSTTVMVVDVVKSTEMKEGVDPLVVEYSFRRLQQWIEDISASHAGSVRSTAGDSAVVSFPNCHNAYIAATEIQRRLPDLNQNWNRMPSPFRVRCGLHVGEVQGDLGKIQFAQVIDLAAHMQKMAPTGGIAASREVVESLDPKLFVPLAVQTDGHDVFLALNPTGS